MFGPGTWFSDRSEKRLASERREHPFVQLNLTENIHSERMYDKCGKMVLKNKADKICFLNFLKHLVVLNTATPICFPDDSIAGTPLLSFAIDKL